MPIPNALYRPAASARTGAGTIVVTIPLAYARRWRLVLQNDSTSTGNITAVSWRRSAVGSAYGPAASQTVSAPVAPGASWGASDDGDCVDQLELTITVSNTATVTVSLAGV
jgi:hypothetical protein